MNSKEKMRGSLLDIILKYVSVLSLICLIFALGVVVGGLKVFPYPLFRDAYSAAKALYSSFRLSQNAYITDLWGESRTTERGTTRHDDDAAFAGLTLYTSGHAQAAFLVDMKGNVVHTWERKFREIWQEPPHVPRPVPSSNIYFRKAHLFPNGDLLAILVGEGDTPWGYGLVKLDKDSNIIWSYPERVHHDLDVAPDGRIYTLVHHFGEAIRPSNGSTPDAVLVDYLVVLTPDGTETDRINIYDALGTSVFTGLSAEMAGLGDPTHTNGLTLVTPATAAAHRYLSEGEVVVSMRSLDALAAIDLDREQVTWAARGSWRAQHDPDLLLNGRILLFDNLGHLGRGGQSRVMEFDPQNRSLHWSYSGDEENPLFSFWRSAQQRLPNGNTLITESDAGRILEVTMEGQVVWEFVNPHRGGADGNLIPVVSGATRYRAEDLEFLDAD